MVVGPLLVKPKEIKVQIRRSVKAGSVFLALALITTSCSSSDPQARIDELVNGVCKIMRPIGFDFTDATIQALDESVQRELLANISEIKTLEPTLLDMPLATLCS
jgi:hypothetical protein